MADKWAVHFLNADDALKAVIADVDAALCKAQSACHALHDAVPVDIIVRATKAPMPRDISVFGAAFRPREIEINVDTARDWTPTALQDAVLRTIYHEYHHAMRWEGPGYGTTLGEALVSEGLAQHFVHEMMTCPAEPWERALDETTLREASGAAQRAFADAVYDHAAWFFGTQQWPNCAGYSVGFDLVGRAMAQDGSTALEWAHRPADAFRPLLSGKADKG